MTTPDPLLTAAREIYAICIQDVRASIQGLDLDGLHWRPVAAETNTPAILISHALGSFRDWTCIALNVKPPHRSQADEFLTHFDSIEAARVYVDNLVDDTLRILNTATSPDWAEICREDSPEEPAQTRAYALCMLSST